MIGEYAHFIGRARVTSPARNSLLAWNANDKGFSGNRAIFNGGAANRGTSGMRIVHFGIFRTRGAHHGGGDGGEGEFGELALMAARVAPRRGGSTCGRAIFTGEIRAIIHGKGARGETSEQERARERETTRILILPRRMRRTGSR